MSLNGALHNALSGLYASGRRSELVASNIANVDTPGFGRRSLNVSAASLGDIGGVMIDGVSRASDPVLLNDKRLTSASVANQQTTLGFLTTFENILGTADNGASLAGRLATFENSLITAASRPEAKERLDGVAVSAKSLAQTLNSASAKIQESRVRADSAIETQVATVNSVLSSLEDLNNRIASSGGLDRDNTALRDQRQVLIDELSEIIPVRLANRQNDKVAIYTTGGEILLDGRAAQFGFNASPVIEADMTLASGALSGLTLDGRALVTDANTSPVRGGSLIAQFSLRDDLAVDSQAQLDAVARDLITRFEGITEDTSRGTSDPGLFTDQDAPLDPTKEVGLAARISLHSDVDMSQGGQTWKVRDGLNATTTGNVGDAALLFAYRDALDAKSTPISGDFGVGSFSASGLAAALTTQVGSARLFAEKDLSFAATQLAELNQRELAQGVDTDAELQNLIRIEQAYAANARILQTVDELMQLLTRI